MFIYLREFFFEVKTKEKDGNFFYIKCLMFHNLPLLDLIKIVREEMNKIKIYMKPQAIIFHLIQVTEWFIKLHTEIDINHMQ